MRQKAAAAEDVNNTSPFLNTTTHVRGVAVIDGVGRFNVSGIVGVPYSVLDVVSVDQHMDMPFPIMQDKRFSGLNGRMIVGNRYKFFSFHVSSRAVKESPPAKRRRLGLVETLKHCPIPDRNDGATVGYVMQNEDTDVVAKITGSGSGSAGSAIDANGIVLTMSFQAADAPGAPPITGASHAPSALPLFSLPSPALSQDSPSLSPCFHLAPNISIEVRLLPTHPHFYAPIPSPPIGIHLL